MKKFNDALNGLKMALNHKAVIIQVVLGILAVLGGLIIRLDSYEWLSFIICIALVIEAEIFNTAIEKIGDYLNENQDSRIGAIKDLSSAAVLASALGALVVCIICVIRRMIC